MTHAALRKGDRIRVVAPGFAVRHDALDSGLSRLERMGFAVELGEHARDRDGYFAGDREARLDDVNRALADPGVRGIWFARGGFGAARLLEGIDWKAARRHRKVFAGYSDNTAFFAAVARQAASICLYGPVVAELGDRGAFHAPSLRACLDGRSQTIPFARRQVLAPGHVEGPLLGGNLTVLVHLLGTPWFPDLRGSILLLEDVGEEVYRLDRMLTHLDAAGALDGVRAVLLGSLDPPPTRRAFPPDPPLRTMLLDRLGRRGIPVVTGLPVGHCRAKRTVPLGGRARVDTARGRLTTVARVA